MQNRISELSKQWESEVMRPLSFIEYWDNYSMGMFGCPISIHADLDRMGTFLEQLRSDIVLVFSNMQLVVKNVGEIFDEEGLSEDGHLNYVLQLIKDLGFPSPDPPYW